MNIPFVDLKSQYELIKDEIDRVITDVLSKSAFIGGPYVESFENAFAKFCNRKHCVGVGNGTDALYIALRALGIGPGDEVITAANSFIATSEAITMAGAKVVFVDINPRTYNIDVNKIEEKISDRTKAVIPVHLYGQSAEMDEISEVARKYRLKVVEDAAQAHDGMYKGRKVGSLGNAACFSFYPGKNLGAYGDAGAIVTDDEELTFKARQISNHGRSAKYNHELEGVNSRLDGIQAAILGVKLKHLPSWTEARRKNAYLYNKYLSSNKYIETRAGVFGYPIPRSPKLSFCSVGEQSQDTALITPEEIDDVKAVYHLYVVRVNAQKRSSLKEFLKSKGIATGIHYPVALPNLKAYSYLNHKESDFPEASKASYEILSLPMFPELTESQIQYVTDNIKEFFSDKTL